MKQTKSLLLLLLVSVLCLAGCTAPVQPGDTTPPTVGMKISINGEWVELGSDIEYTAEYGDEIEFYASGQDEQGLMCVKIWMSSYYQKCRIPGSSLVCEPKDVKNPEPPGCESDAKVGDEAPTTLLDTRDIKVVSELCKCGGEGAERELDRESGCLSAFAKNFGSGPDAETISISPAFCYEYRAD